MIDSEEGGRKSIKYQKKKFIYRAMVATLPRSQIGQGGSDLLECVVGSWLEFSGTVHFAET